MTERSLVTMLGNEMLELVDPVLAAGTNPEALARLAWQARWTVPEFHVLDHNALSTAVTSLETALNTVTGDGLTAASLDAVTSALDAVRGIFVAVDETATIVTDIFDDPTAPEVPGLFLADLAEVLILDWLGRRAPQLYEILELATIIGPEVPSEVIVGEATFRVPVTRTGLHLDRFGDLLADPLGHLGAEYFESGSFSGPDDAEALIQRFFPKLVGFIGRFEGLLLVRDNGQVPESLRPEPLPPGAERIANLVLPLPAAGTLIKPELLTTIELVPPGTTATGSGTAGPGVEITPTGLVGVDVTSGLWTISIDVTGSPGRFFLSPDGVTGSGAGLNVDGRLLRGDGLTPSVVIGGNAGTRLTIGRLVLDGFISASANAPDYGLGIAAENARLEVSAGDGDGFLSSVLPPDGIGVDFDLGLAWSKTGGLKLGGSVGLAITIPTAINVGGIGIDQFELTLAALDGGLTLTAGLAASVDLGVFEAVVEGLGLGIDLMPATAPPGNLGPFDAGLRFQLPRGIGVSVDAGVATGGGYLFADHVNHTYGGVIDIDVLAVGISAVGVVNTQPVDVDGWSMLFALFIDVPSIPIGFGFTLEGVGGLAGVNRTIDADALTSLVRSGSMDAILFPANPIADAPQIIDQLQAVFPPADGSYVFGPVVKIGWGTPTIIEAAIGVAIALPDPVSIAVLGSISAVLPRPELELAAINLDVAGIVDFGQATLAIDASLHDSHIVGFALSGDMALRADFGSRPSFLFALGGFHPGFDPPPGFPALNRLSLSLNGGPLLQLSFESYLAIGSNTVQFGAAFEIWAKIAGFGIEGGTEFDAMVQFNPFEVATSVGFHIAVTAIGLDLAGVWLDASVTGPNPWTVIGSARFKVLGIQEEIHVDETIGSRSPEPIIPRAALFEELVQALIDDGAWEAISVGAESVVLSDADQEDDRLFANPDGIVRVTQRAVPLRVTVDKAGNALAGDHDTFWLESEGLGISGQTNEWFAPAYFFEMSPTERLSAPSFEQLEAGIEFGQGAPVAGPAIRGNLNHEQILRDPELKEDRVELARFSTVNDKRPAIGQVVSQSTAAFALADESAPVSVNGAKFAVSNRESGEVRAISGSWSSARHILVGRDADNAVVPSWEIGDGS